MSNKDLGDDIIRAQISKLLAETANINQKMRWYVVVLLVGAVAAFSTAMIAIGKYWF